MAAKATMTDKRAKEAVEYLDKLIEEQQKKLLSGEARADTPEQTAVNYQAGTLLSKHLVRLRKQIAEIFSKEEEDDGER